MEDRQSQILQKALEVNLNPNYYGTFAEIGAGQEVARNFFVAGGASGTIAKAMSAYDMVFSDIIYGKETSGRYVVESRCQKMLKREFELLVERLEKIRPEQTQFFALANTVALSKYKQKSEAHGWMGVRFQHTSKSEPSEVLIHCRMLDEDNVEKQNALGELGVNLVYASFFLLDNPKKFVASLMDSLSRHRIEIDLIKVEGPGFKDYDNRLLNLILLKLGYTDAVMFDGKGGVILPFDNLYRKDVLVLRGSFRPPTLVNMDMLKIGQEAFEKWDGVDKKNVVVVTEITTNNLKASGDYDDEDFLARVDLLEALGQKVLISQFQEYYKLSSYFTRFNNRRIGIVLGIKNLQDIFDAQYYQDLPGGIMQAFGLLFTNNVKMYVYPKKIEGEKNCITAKGALTNEKLRSLFNHLIENNSIEDLKGFDLEVLDIDSKMIPDMIVNNDPEWEKLVPSSVVATVKSSCLFGFPCEIEIGADGKVRKKWKG